MKKATLLFMAFLFAISFAGNAQTQKKDGDTTKIRIGSKKIIIIETDKGKGKLSDSLNDGINIVHSDSSTRITINTDSIGEKGGRHRRHHGNTFEGHWHGFEFGIDNYVDKNGKMLNDKEPLALNQGKSWDFSLNLLQYSIPIVKNHFGLVTGLGLEWNNYTFANRVSLLSNADVVMTISDTLAYSKNKLRTTYLTAPLILEYQTRVGSSDKKFWIGAGILCGVKLGSSTKQEWTVGNTDYEYIVHDDYNLNTFRYGFTARMGYNNWGVFANYNMTPLFKHDKAPYDLFPFTVGIKVLNF